MADNSPTIHKPTHFNSWTFASLKHRVVDGFRALWQDKRVRWGLIILLVLAPVAKFIYLSLPTAGFGEYFINVGFLKIRNTIEVLHEGEPLPGEWQFRTLREFMFVMGELMAPLLAIFGIFLLFPKRYYPSYLVGVPFGYYLSMVVQRTFITSDQEYYQGGAGTIIMLTFLFLGIVIFMVSDKVLFQQHHRKRASEARIIGLINMPGMSWQDKEAILKK